MALKYRKNYTVPYSGEKAIDDDYWFEWWHVSGKYKSCMSITDRIPLRLVIGKEDFFLLSMNKKRDVLDSYKRVGRELMYLLYTGSDV